GGGAEGPGCRGEAHPARGRSGRPDPAALLPQPAAAAHLPGPSAQSVRLAPRRSPGADQGGAGTDAGGLRQMKDARSIVRRALITEKGTVLRERRNQYHFEVAREANKIEIKHAVEHIFNVKVADVRTMNVAGKPK